MVNCALTQSSLLLNVRSPHFYYSIKSTLSKKPLQNFCQSAFHRNFQIECSECIPNSRGNAFKVESRNVAVRSSTDRSSYDLADEELSGPIELPPGDIEIGPLDIPEASPLQTFASIILTGSITLLLLRSLRRRSQRSKEMKFRSNAVEKLSPSKDSFDSLNSDSKPNTSAIPSDSRKTPTALNTFGGALVAGLIAVILYRFTSNVEDGFANQAVSANYSVRNLTITVRTIITGICWLSTFVFGFSSAGLSLYAFQIALNLVPNEDIDSASPNESSKEKEKEKVDS